MVGRPMRAVTFQAPGEVLVEEVPDPELQHPEDALVRVEASGICGSDLHIYHGRVPVERGFTIGHEFVGTVLAVGDDVTGPPWVIACSAASTPPAARASACVRGDYHRCLRGRTFGHGAKLGDLQGAQAEQLLVPRANLTLRRVPEGMSAEVALFAGDVMGTGYHAIAHAGMRAGDTVAVLGLGPVGLCAVQAARASGATQVFAIDTVAPRLALAESFGATPDPPHRGGAQARHSRRDRGPRCGRGGRRGRRPRTARARGQPCPRRRDDLRDRRLRGAWRRAPGSGWLKGLTIRAGLANVIAHVDRVLSMMSAGLLDPGPLVTHHMSLDEAGEAYALYDRREALKIVLQP